MALGDNVDYVWGDPCPFCAVPVAFVSEVRSAPALAVTGYVLAPCGHRLSGFWMAKVRDK